MTQKMVDTKKFLQHVTIVENIGKFLPQNVRRYIVAASSKKQVLLDEKQIVRQIEEMRKALDAIENFLDLSPEIECIEEFGIIGGD